MRDAAAVLELPTSWGPIRLESDGGVLTRCTLPVARPSASPGSLSMSPPTPEERAASRVLQQAARFVRTALSGASAPCPALATPLATAFTLRVWAVLRAIPRGQVLTYAEVAAAAGSPRAAGAAGSACADNPLPLFVPCHRVVGAGGALGGYTGGLPWKRALLALEGVSCA